MRLAALLCALCQSLSAHTRFVSEQGVPAFLPDYTDVSMQFNEGIRADATNSSGRQLFNPGSNPIGALQAAASTWSSVENSRMRFAALQSTPFLNDSKDNRNTISIRDTPEIRSLVGDALAVTVVITVPGTGEVLDSDILFSPSYADRGFPFSTNGAPNTFDFQAVATHEMGHVLGAGHTHLLASTLYPFGGSVAGRILSPDETAFAREVAPFAGTTARYGELRGTLTLSTGQPARRMTVTATDASSGVTVGALTDATGAFAIRSVPAGNYVVYAEPMLSLASPSSFQLLATDVDVNAEASFFSARRPVLIAAGQSSSLSFLLPARTGSVRIDSFRQGATGGSGDFSLSSFVSTTGGNSFDILIFGPGIDTTLSPQDLEILGANATIRQGSVRIDPRLVSANGTQPLRFTVDVADTSQRSYASLLVRRGSGLSTAPGSILVEPTQGQFLSLTSGSIVNAATATAGAVAANSWVSIFGKNLAREFILGSASLPTEIDGTRVLITDSRGGIQLGRLQFISPEQINFLMPASAPGTARITVTSLLGQGVAEVTVAAVAPGIFAANSNGRGPAAAAFVTVLPGGAQQSGLTFLADRTPRENLPVVLGAPGTQVYLTFYGTGLRAHASPVTATIGGLDVPVLAAVAQGQFAGLDQINVGPLPAALAGRGEVNVNFLVDGRATNPVTVSIR